MNETPGRAPVVFITPSLVVLGNLVVLVWLSSLPASLDKLGPVLGYMFGVLPLSLVFLVAYIVTARSFRAAARPRSRLAVSAFATLVGLAACAASVGVFMGLSLLEAML